MMTLLQKIKPLLWIILATAAALTVINIIRGLIR